MCGNAHVTSNFLYRLLKKIHTSFFLGYFFCQFFCLRKIFLLKGWSPLNPKTPSNMIWNNIYILGFWNFGVLGLLRMPYWCYWPHKTTPRKNKTFFQIIQAQSSHLYLISSRQSENLFFHLALIRNHFKIGYHIVGYHGLFYFLFFNGVGVFFWIVTWILQTRYGRNFYRAWSLIGRNLFVGLISHS